MSLDENKIILCGMACGVAAGIVLVFVFFLASCGSACREDYDCGKGRMCRMDGVCVGAERERIATR